MINDPCLDCGKPTLGVITMADGSTVGIGMNRLSYDDGWRCGECAGYECDSCGKNIYLDEDITVVNEEGHNNKYHYDCLTPEIKLLAIEQGEIANLCEICEGNEKENPEGKWCASCKDDYKESVHE
jgi:hypothetical protein